MKRLFYILFFSLILLSSCSSTQSLSRRGVERTKVYYFQHKDIPKEFDGFRIAFASDFHYKSTLQEKGLNKLVKQLQDLHADIFLMGGDYIEGCENTAELFEKLAQVKTRFGTYAIMGNHDLGDCKGQIVEEMKKNGITILSDTVDTIPLHDEKIMVAGVRNSFKFTEKNNSPTSKLSPDDFVILLSHTPDYAEKGDITNTDLFLAGHTHGGQVTLFGLYAPVTASAYGQKFRSGKTENSHHQTMIITNGIGTSRHRIRLFAPSEVVLVVLKSEKSIERK
jgi:predicted MPP superfamily phosphohydrolase